VRALDMIHQVQDANLGNQETEKQLTMQLTKVMTALRDPSAIVRITAVTGACNMLTTWWELLPAQAMTKILILLQDNAHDSVSPRARIALLLGVRELVDNPLVRAGHSQCHSLVPLHTLHWGTMIRSRCLQSTNLPLAECACRAM
jgi:hypothetical protein